jgi:preprotein translocase subunit Sec63
MTVKGSSSNTPQAQVDQAFGKNKTLYEILGVAKDASAAAIRKAYFKLALTCVSTCACVP